MDAEEIISNFISLWNDDGNRVRVNLDQVRKFQNLEEDYVNYVRITWANGDEELLLKRDPEMAEEEATQ